MAKEYAKKFYKSKAWQKCRASFIGTRVNIDGGMCQHCNQRLGYIVDHVVEITPDNIDNPEITLNHDNLQFVCLSCHNTKHFGNGKGVIREGLSFDKDGNIIEKMV